MSALCVETVFSCPHYITDNLKETRVTLF